MLSSTLFTNKTAALFNFYSPEYLNPAYIQRSYRKRIRERFEEHWTIQRTRRACASNRKVSRDKIIGRETTKREMKINIFFLDTKTIPKYYRFVIRHRARKLQAFWAPLLDYYHRVTSVDRVRWEESSLLSPVRKDSKFPNVPSGIVRIIRNSFEERVSRLIPGEAAINASTFTANCIRSTHLAANKPRSVYTFSMHVLPSSWAR